MSSDDTIFALASARGRAGVSVIRISGADAKRYAEFLVGGLTKPRHAHLRDILDPDSGDKIDQGVVLWFEEGASFTGEPVVELQVHGSVSVVDEILEVLGRFKGARIAESGEFTKRALLNDKMDLTQVEGLADLIDSETIEQRKQASRIMRGELSAKTDRWRNKLLEIKGLIEATIDFSDEELPDGVLDPVVAQLRALHVEFQQELLGSEATEIIRSGFIIAIVGKPNAGKSSLLNALAGRDIAITSDIAGTTRDVIEVSLNLSGYSVTLLDTAGIHDSVDQIEKLGISRAYGRAKEADLRLFVLDVGQTLDDLSALHVDDDLVVFSKQDLGGDADGLHISAKTGVGLEKLLDQIGSELASRVSSSSSLIRQRHRDSLRQSSSLLAEVVELMRSGDYDIEVASEELRSAINHIDHIVGKIDVESVLGQIFSSFCIGK